MMSRVLRNAAFVVIALLMCLALPLSVRAETVTCVNSYAGYQKKTYALPPNTQNPGPNQHNSLATNAGAAKGDVGKTYFTIELTSFNDKTCTWGACQNNVPGIAHRTWPPNSCVVVCNSQNKKCAVAIVMDRGPNTRLGCRTIDANPALQIKLGMVGKTVPATYQLKSIPPEKCEQIPIDISAVPPSVQSSGYTGPSTQPSFGPSGFPSAAPPQASAPSAQQLLSPPPPVPITANQPLPQPISSSILTASSPTLEETEGNIPESKSVSELLAALARPTTSLGFSPTKSPFKLSETVGVSNAAHLSSGSTTSSSQATSTSLNPPQSTNTFSSTYRSPDLRWSTPTLFQPFWRDVEMMVRSLIDLLKRL